MSLILLLGIHTLGPGKGSSLCSLMESNHCQYQLNVKSNEKGEQLRQPDGTHHIKPCVEIFKANSMSQKEGLNPMNCPRSLRICATI